MTTVGIAFCIGSKLSLRSGRTSNSSLNRNGFRVGAPRSRERCARRRDLRPGLAQVHRDRDPDLVALVALDVMRQPRLEHDQAARLRLHRDLAPRQQIASGRLRELAVASPRADRVRHHDAAAVLRRFDVVAAREQAPVVRVLGLLRAGLEDVDPGTFDLETPRRQPQPSRETSWPRRCTNCSSSCELCVGQDLCRGLVVGGRDGLLGRGLDVALGALGLQIRGHLGVDGVAHGRVDVLDEQRHGENEVDGHGGAATRRRG